MDTIDGTTKHLVRPPNGRVASRGAPVETRLCLGRGLLETGPDGTSIVTVYLELPLGELIRAALDEHSRLSSK